MEDSSNLNSHALKRFLKHLFIVSKKYRESELAKKGLEKQIKKVKTIPFKNPKRWLVEKELKILESRINNVLSKEAEVLKLGKEESCRSIELNSRIEELERQLRRSIKIGEEDKEKIAQLSLSLDEMKQSLGDRLEREKRIKELEKRVVATSKKRKEFSALGGQIKNLEEKYNLLKEKGIGKEKLVAIKEKIDSLKYRIAAS